MRIILDRAHRRAALLVVAALVISAAVRADDTKGGTAAKPVSREGGWIDLHKSYVARAKEGSIDLLFVGDSITQGWDNNDAWRRHYAPRHAANFGIGGDCTQHLLWRLANGEVDAIAPKVVVLMIGTNNIGANTPDEIAEGIKAIVTALRTRLPKTKVLLLGIFPRGEKPGPIREHIKAVNDAIAKLDDGKTVSYLDIGRHFLNGDGTISPDVMADYAHLSHKGYMIWADAMEPTLWKLLDEETPG